MDTIRCRCIECKAILELPRDEVPPEERDLPLPEPDPTAHMRPCPAPAFDDLPLDLQLQRIEHIRLHITGACRCRPGPTDHAVLRLLWEYDEIERELNSNSAAVAGSRP